MIETRITKLLGIKYPIFQGGMAWVSSSALVAAVSNAGGLGVFGSGSLEPELARQEIRRIKELTDKPFGVNIMLMMPTAPGVVEVCIQEKVPVVTTGAGNPGPLVKRFKDEGIKIIPVVSSVALAKRLERSGVDALIAEGHESGGHVGELTSMVLIPQVVDAVSIPVIAAGGIADGRGVAAAFALGAEAVQMGTRFILAKECHAHQNYKESVLKAKDRDTVTTGVTLGHPVRVIRNRLTKEYLEKEYKGATPDELEELGRGRLKMSVVDGNTEEGSVMAGQISGMLNREETAAEIIQSIEADYYKVFERLQLFKPACKS
ncbi:MAG: enoyl-[acyl-carrier-protein] reductase FabK [Candidatus Riflebacteria bacterium]|jgi:enoyl-[acyl-carrier protein] reductase II|nr:enoyl-[acyl-carrier-protein] reductase FabK [Candidatus Riflebacteria bacterium]